jgi:hypothetical protein
LKNVLGADVAAQNEGQGQQQAYGWLVHSATGGG